MSSFKQVDLVTTGFSCLESAQYVLNGEMIDISENDTNIYISFSYIIEGERIRQVVLAANITHLRCSVTLFLGSRHLQLKS